MDTNAMFSSKTSEWETPQDFYDRLDGEFHFTLDPAASDDNHKCEKYYTKNQDGLIHLWANETVFCNPPYGQQIGQWVEKGYITARNSDKPVVMLLPARTDTRWFHDYIYGKAEVRFIRGRLKFGDSKHNAPFPSMVVIWR